MLQLDDFILLRSRVFVLAFARTQVSVAVLLDNFITAATRIEFEERLQDSERQHR